MYKLVLVLLAALTLSACGAGSTTVVDAYDGATVNYAAAQVESGDATVSVPDEIMADFKEAMSKEFYEKGLFTEGPGLKVKYTFIQFEGGNQFSRWFFGGIGNAGEASMTIQVDFFDENDTKLSTINVGGKIGSGFFGGSVSEAVGKAAKEAAEYAAATFI